MTLVACLRPVVISAGFVVGISPSAICASNQPVAGTYFNTATITSVSNCPSDVFAVGQTTTGYFTYPGPGNSGAAFRTGSSSTSGGQVTVLAYPGKMPGAGVTTWSGQGTGTVEPSGNSYTLTFKATFTFVDSYSWLAEQRVQWNFSGFPDCTTKTTQALVYTGM
jgi:hypothetical protein